jgi:hypothetical protein
MKLPHYRVTWFVNEMAKLSKDFATVVNATHFAEKKVASESSVDYANVYRVEKSAEALDYTDETLLYQFKRIPAHDLARLSTRGWTDQQLLEDDPIDDSDENGTVFWAQTFMHDYRGEHTLVGEPWVPVVTVVPDHTHPLKANTSCWSSRTTGSK